LKIAMFTDSFYPTVDGAVVAMERQCRELERRGHEIVVIAPDTPRRQDAGWRVHYLPSMEFRSYKGYRIVVSPADMLEYLRGQEVDMIHCHGLASMAILSLTAARALGKPHVLTFHTMANEAVKYYSFIGLREDLTVPLVWVYLRNLLKRPDMVVFPSRPIEEELVAKGVRTNARAVIPTGVDTRLYRPENADPGLLERFSVDGGRVLLHVGRLSKEKRLDIVLRAVASLKEDHPDLRLLVAGTGPAHEDYRAMADRLGLKDRVVFTGFLPDGDLRAAYATADMLVIPSTFETQGLVVLEAMASGTPVVGIRRRAIPEFVKDGVNGCLFEEGSCAEAITRCLDEGASYRDSALRTAGEYSIDRCTAMLERAYETAAEVKDRRAG
jgi:1,2-diacylglycerol 3-alpha-glucosyltransferase